MCDDDRLNLLSSRLERFKSKVRKDLSFRKENKLRKLSATPQRKCRSKTWLPSLGLTTTDRNNLLDSNFDLDDFIINKAANMVVADYPFLIIQPPCFIHSSGYDYCPHETIQITHNGAHHWILLSSIGGEVKIFDSLDMPVTETIKNQMKNYFFSPDYSIPVYRVMKCQKQVGSHDFSIANAKGSIQDVVFDQSKMRVHLVSCFEAGKISPFPKYRVPSTKKKDTEQSSSQDSDWQMPSRSLRIGQKQECSELKLMNRFIPETLSNHLPRILTGRCHAGH